MQTVPARLIRTNPIKAALTLVPPAELSEVDTHIGQLAALEERISALDAVKKRLLRVETAAQAQATLQISKLEGERDKLRDSEEAAALVQAFPEFSLEPFRWRDDAGLPRLAAFALDGAEFKIEVKVSSRYGQVESLAMTMSPHLPVAVAARYADVVGAILEKMPYKAGDYGGEKTMFLSATFAGVVPAHVKARISAFSRRFKSTLIIAEVADWKYGEVVQPKQVDPLVVGWDGETFRLIAAFDLTDVETAARDYLKMS